MDLFFYLTILATILFFGTFNLYIDFDFWARLIVGKTFFQTGTLLNHDFYSFGTTHQFIDHEWGSSLIFYLIQDNFGDIGIYIFKSFLVFITWLVIVAIIKLEKPGAKMHFLLFYFTVQTMYYNIFQTIRCQSFSFFFFVLYLYILRYAREKNNYRILWTIPVLNIVWQNIHGGFAVGLVSVLIFGFGEFLNKNQNYKKYLYSFLATLATLIINPYGFKYISFIVDAFKLERTFITEWQSAFFNPDYIHLWPKFKLFLFVVLIFFAFAIVKHIKEKTKVDWSKYLLIAFCGVMALKSMRCQVFFSYIVLAFCYNDFYKIFNKKLPVVADNIKEVILLVCISIAAFCHIYSTRLLNGVRANDYPIYCVEFMKQNNLKGNIFTIFHTGSYVAYKLYPNNFVYMDGRYEEVYDVNLINEMNEFFLGLNHREFLKKYHFDILIVDKEYNVAIEKLSKNPDWFMAYESDYYALFLPKSLKNKKFVLPKKDLKYYYKNKFETNITFE